MNYRMVGYLLSLILLLEAALLLFPTAVALIYGEPVLPFLWTIAILAVLSLPGLLQKPKNRRFYAREGFVCSALAWLLLSAFGALPFMFSGAMTSYADALFETVSGFTTTGATILTAVEGLPYSILFWRAFTHWIGGMGVLVFVLAFLPTDDGRAIHLLRAEVPGPNKGKLVPKLRHTALILYGIYLALTVLETVALCMAGLPFLDALTNAFSTTGTGGFSLKNASIAGYQNPAAEWIIAIFMFLCGVNFNLYFFLLIRHFRDAFHSEELWAYTAITLVATGVVCWNTFSLFTSFGDCLRTAFFQVTSLMSTTGFATADFAAWPALSQAVLMLVVFIGGCAGSTAGGLKVSRVLLLFKGAAHEVKHILRPKSVNVARLDGSPISGETLRAASNYLVIYWIFFLSSVLLLSVDGFDMLPNITGVLVCLNNTGPGLGMVGPYGNFAPYSVLSKLVLSVDMLLGRLEFFPLIVLCAPGTWKRRA